MIRRPPRSPLFPSTTLFRSCSGLVDIVRKARQRRLALKAPIEHQRSRSEEHTSELQSRQYLVCRLLLEKKNNGDGTSLLTLRLQTAVDNSVAGFVRIAVVRLRA